MKKIVPSELGRHPFTLAIKGRLLDDGRSVSIERWYDPEISLEFIDLIYCRDGIESWDDIAHATYLKRNMLYDGSRGFSVRPAEKNGVNVWIISILASNDEKGSDG